MTEKEALGELEYASVNRLELLAPNSRPGGSSTSPVWRYSLARAFRWGGPDGRQEYFYSGYGRAVSSKTYRHLEAAIFHIYNLEI